MLKSGRMLCAIAFLLSFLVSCPQNPDDLRAPTGAILINDDDDATNSASVILSLNATDTESPTGIEMMISESVAFTGASWEAFARTKEWTLTGVDGNKKVYALFRDAAGNISETYLDAITLDTAAPSGLMSVNNGDAYTSQAAVTLGLTAVSQNGEAAATMMLSNQANFSGSLWEAYSASKSWVLSSGDGEKTVYAKFRDALGNESAAFSDAIILDTSLPAAPSAPDLAAEDDTGLSSTDAITNKTSGLTFTGSGGELGGGIQLYSGSILIGSGDVDIAGNWSIDISLSEGVSVLYAKSVDPAGQESAASASLNITIDITPPAAGPAIIKPEQGKYTGINLRPHFTWTSVGGAASYELQADDNQDSGSPEYQWSQIVGTSFTPAADMVISSTAPVGRRYYLRARALDLAGNAGPWSNQDYGRYVNVGRTAKDFNGDGYADMLVGARSYNSGQGRAYIYYGGPSMDTTADLTLTGEAMGDNFGLSVASAGDVNGDGYSDMLVGAYGYNSQQGRAYMYYGGPSMDTTADLTLTGEAMSNFFGYNVASAGDVNGDGYTDMLVGAYGYNSNQGRAYMYYGGPSMDTTADLTLTGEATDNFFGISVASAGDINGDGYADMLVGAYWNNSIGRMYMYYGGPSMDTTVDLTLTGEAAGNFFGNCVASAGDINGDGYADMLVGANGYNSSQGRAYMYYGGPAMDTTADLTLTGEGAGDRFGMSVASAGDVNGDGCADMLVGAYSYNSNQGRAYMYYGGPAMDNTADLTLTGEAMSNFFGYNVASAGDVNGDGYTDMLVGAYGYNSNQGRAYMYYGGPSMDTTADLTLTGEATGNAFGISVASAGDVSGDTFLVMIRIYSSSLTPTSSHSTPCPDSMYLDAILPSTSFKYSG